MLCRVCNKDKRSCYFPNKANRAGYICLECKRKKDRINYMSNPSVRIKRKLSTNERVESLQNIVFQESSKLGCFECGNKDPFVLKFHLREGQEHARYNKSVVALVQSGGEPTHLYNEFERCVVRCANCQQRKEYNEERIRRHEQNAQLKESISRIVQESSLRVHGGNTSESDSSMDSEPDPLQLQHTSGGN